MTKKWIPFLFLGAGIALVAASASIRSQSFQMTISTKASLALPLVAKKLPSGMRQLLDLLAIRDTEALFEIPLSRQDSPAVLASVNSLIDQSFEAPEIAIHSCVKFISNFDLPHLCFAAISRAMQKSPFDWRLPLLQGLVEFSFLNNKERADFFFDRARGAGNTPETIQSILSLNIDQLNTGHLVTMSSVFLNDNLQKDISTVLRERG